MPYPTPARRLGEVALVSAAIALVACGSPANRGEDVDQLFEDANQGIVTELREVSAGEWRIADERVVDDSTQSRVIATRLDGATDTFTLDQIGRDGAVAAADSTSGRGYRRGSFFTPILFYGLFGSRFGRSYGFAGAGPRPGAYVNRGTYNRVQSTAGNQLRTARPGGSARPSSSRTGYGSGRSTRSFGG